MTKRRKNKKSQTDLKELVVVAFAEDLEHAKDYETLLKNNEIPVMIKQRENNQTGGQKSIAVMVPEEYADEAHVIIESQDVYDDLYELGIDEEDDEFATEPFDDNF